LSKEHAGWQEGRAYGKAVGNADISKEVASSSPKDDQLVCRIIYIFVEYVSMFLDSRQWACYAQQHKIQVLQNEFYSSIPNVSVWRVL
jgi:hypothetical protein